MEEEEENCREEEEEEGEVEIEYLFARRTDRPTDILTLSYYCPNNDLFSFFPREIFVLFQKDL